MKKNNHFPTGKLPFFLMLLAMVLLVACGGNSKKDRSDDEEDEEDTEAVIDDEEDSFDEDENEYENDVDDEDDYDADDEYLEYKAKAISLFKDCYNALLSTDVEGIHDKILAFGFSLENAEGATLTYSYPNGGEAAVGANDDIGMYISFDNVYPVEYWFRHERERRGFERDPEIPAFASDGKVTFEETVDGIRLRLTNPGQ
ncbi:MAG: hypothetical protein J5797_06885 [Prevotella sp.]|nr:hypothetical protein [Prevotella sp.]